MSETILPTASSDLEKRLESAISAAHPVLNAIAIDKVWNPETCPVEVLPYLAWALSVDNWSNAWSDEIKRKVIKNSFAIHARKGTRLAVEMALESLGVIVDVKEWFELEEQGEPGTFELTAWVNENLSRDKSAVLNAELYALLKSAIDRSKSARAHYGFKVGAKFDPLSMGVASSANSAGLMRRGGSAKQSPLEMSAGVGVLMAGQSSSISKNLASAVVEAHPEKTGVYFGATVQAASVIYKRMEAQT